MKTTEALQFVLANMDQETLTKTGEAVEQTIAEEGEYEALCDLGLLVQLEQRRRAKR